MILDATTVVLRHCNDTTVVMWCHCNDATAIMWRHGHDTHCKNTRHSYKAHHMHCHSFLLQNLNTPQFYPYNNLLHCGDSFVQFEMPQSYQVTRWKLNLFWGQNCRVWFHWEPWLGESPPARFTVVDIQGIISTTRTFAGRGAATCTWHLHGHWW